MEADTREVALRKESVDRNPRRSADCSCHNGSLSARRAWIEISGLEHIIPVVESLSARRAWIEIPVVVGSLTTLGGRSPQGERG